MYSAPKIESGKAMAFTYAAFVSPPLIGSLRPTIPPFARNTVSLQAKLPQSV